MDDVSFASVLAELEQSSTETSDVVEKENLGKKKKHVIKESDHKAAPQQKLQHSQPQEQLMSVD